MLPQRSANRRLAGLVAFALFALGCDQPSPTQPSPASYGPLSVAFITPTAGPADVAGTVVITGTGFLAGATVTFDGHVAKVTSLTATSIAALTPTHSEGEVDLTVINPGGQSVTLFHAFTYARMAVTSVSPAAGIIGKWARVRGFGFSSGVSVSFGGSQADVIFESSMSLFALTPPRPAGSVDVVVRNQS